MKCAIEDVMLRTLSILLQVLAGASIPLLVVNLSGGSVVMGAAGIGFLSAFLCALGFRVKEPLRVKEVLMDTSGDAPGGRMYLFWLGRFVLLGSAIAALPAGVLAALLR